MKHTPITIERLESMVNGDAGIIETNNLNDFIFECAKNFERGDADLFSKLAFGKFAYDSTDGKWFQHKKGVWKDINAGITALYQNILREEYSKLYRIVTTDRIDILHKAIKRVSMLRSSEAGIKLAQGLLLTKSEDYDANDMEFNLLNGVFCFQKREFREHLPTDKFKLQVQYEYKEGADCPEFKAFLNRIFSNDEELIQWLRNRIGTTLTGRIPNEELIFGYGTGANGKSILIGVLQMLLHQYCITIRAELVLSKQNSEQDERTLIRLFRSRLCIANELEANRRMNESLVKSLTGGKSDRLTARKLYAELIEFEPTHKLWIFGNYKPNISGTDEAIWRRIKTLPFSVTIPIEERTDKSDLLEVFKNEISGIFNWSVEGFYTKPKEPEAVKLATDIYKVESDSLSQFLEERTTKSSAEREPLKVIFKEYTIWCYDTGNFQIHKTDKMLINAILTNSDYQRGKVNGGSTAVVGLKIKSNQEDAF